MSVPSAHRPHPASIACFCLGLLLAVAAAECEQAAAPPSPAADAVDALVDDGQSALVSSLALDTILISLEDAEPYANPAGAVATIFARMGAAWAATCATLLAG
jgi:hypothetical protein